MAFELDDLLPAGEAADEPQHRHAGLGAGVRKADALGARDHFHELLGDLDLHLSRRREQRAVAVAGADRLD